MFAMKFSGQNLTHVDIGNVLILIIVTRTATRTVKGLMIYQQEDYVIMMTIIIEADDDGGRTRDKRPPTIIIGRIIDEEAD